MEQPRAVENKNFTLATRIEVTQRLAQTDLDLEGFEIAGVPTGTLDQASGQPLRGARKLTEIADFASALLTDPSPDASKADEAHYFLGGVDVADFTIGLLRNFEGLVARYRNALERCEKAAGSDRGERGGGSAAAVRHQSRTGRGAPGRRHRTRAAGRGH